VLPSLCLQADPGFDAAGSDWRRRFGRDTDTRCVDTRRPGRTDPGFTSRSSRPSGMSHPAVRFLHFPDLALSLLLPPSGVIA